MLIVDCASQLELDELLHVSQLLSVLLAVPDGVKDDYLDELVDKVMRRVRVEK